MWRFVARRLMWSVFLFLAVTFVTYIIFFVAPNDPAKLAAGKAANAEQVQQVREYLHLDEPVWKQYALWLKQLVIDGSLGRSFVNRQDVNDVIAAAAPVTASLVFGGAVLWLLVSIPVGVFSALRPRSLLDRSAMIFVLIGISAHPVWIGLILSFVFGSQLGLTPISGYCDFVNPSVGAECGGPVEWAYHLILPWCTFALLFTALYVRLIRANVMETMSEDFVRTARAKGVKERNVLKSHVLRNSMLPIVTILGLDIALALGGAIFTESIFNLPGLGRSVITAYTRADLPVIVGVVVFSTIVIILFNLIVDCLYAVLDPRIRLN
jgi:peptide/nickel transport system permease protein